ncbi:hypothetical protein D9758_011616 [Tetrapyrgos nigripes]|uniref:Uncharacterized protein n=1 Tax=Tetrapyrgos nigripes TaxID=182062 RepID=A0A8H5CTZ8_9AGAR|nr:hypothetical protein D9758_011616 [Tetrapyrgos nigripes]
MGKPIPRPTPNLPTPKSPEESVLTVTTNSPVRPTPNLPLQQSIPSDTKNTSIRPTPNLPLQQSVPSNTTSTPARATPNLPLQQSVPSDNPVRATPSLPLQQSVPSDVTSSPDPRPIPNLPQQGQAKEDNKVEKVADIPVIPQPRKTLLRSMKDRLKAFFHQKAHPAEAAPKTWSLSDSEDVQLQDLTVEFGDDPYKGRCTVHVRHTRQEDVTNLDVKMEFVGRDKERFTGVFFTIGLINPLTQMPVPVKQYKPPATTENDVFSSVTYTNKVSQGAGVEASMSPKVTGKVGRERGKNFVASETHFTIQTSRNNGKLEWRVRENSAIRVNSGMGLPNQTFSVSVETALPMRVELRLACYYMTRFKLLKKMSVPEDNGFLTGTFEREKKKLRIIQQAVDALTKKQNRVGEEREGKEGKEGKEESVGGEGRGEEGVEVR